MEELIAQTLEIASKNFLTFGFKQEQIDQLLASGKRDLEKELAKLKLLVEDEHADIEMINKTLHALKGLFFNMGNMDAGEKMSDLRSEENAEEEIDKIKTLLSH